METAINVHDSKLNSYSFTSIIYILFSPNSACTHITSLLFCKDSVRVSKKIQMVNEREREREKEGWKAAKLLRDDGVRGTGPSP